MLATNMVINNTPFTTVSNMNKKYQQDPLQKECHHFSNNVSFHPYQSQLPPPQVLEAIIVKPHPPKRVYHLYPSLISHILLQTQHPHQTWLSHPHGFALIRFETITINSIGDCIVHLFFQCRVAWRIKLVPIGSSWTCPFHDFVKDAWWQKILVYEQHELKFMWTHVQLAWWWYLELRRDRDVICIMRFEPNLVLRWIAIELMSVQSIEEDLWVFMCTSTFEKGGGLIAVPGIMQTIAVIVNIIASWTIHLAMHIIITLKNGALVVDCCRMRMSSIMFASIGEWRAGQTQHGTAKYIWNFMQSGILMTEGTHFEHMIWTSIIVPIASIHSVMYLHTSQKCWEQQLDDLDNKQDMQGAIAIKWVHRSKWPKYCLSHYSIHAMKQYRCVARIQITLYSNMAYQSLFARDVLYHHKCDD